MKEIITRIITLKKDRNVSEFSRFLGLSQRTVDSYLRGERKPSIELVFRVCEKCNVSSDWLLGLSETAQTPQNAQQSSPERDPKSQESLHLLIRTVSQQQDTIEAQRRELELLKSRQPKKAIPSQPQPETFSRSRTRSLVTK